VASAVAGLNKRGRKRTRTDEQERERKEREKARQHALLLVITVVMRYNDEALTAGAREGAAAAQPDLGRALPPAPEVQDGRTAGERITSPLP
jgi:hypothetical protein